MPDASQFIWLFFKFQGRVSRAAYLLAILLIMLVIAFPYYQFIRVADGIAAPEESGAAQIWAVLFGVAALASLWAQVAITVKRLHDIDKPGYYAASLFIPIVSIIAFVALCFYPGTPGPNRYGNGNS